MRMFKGGNLSSLTTGRQRVIVDIVHRDLPCIPTRQPWWSAVNADPFVPSGSGTGIDQIPPRTTVVR